LKVVKAYRYLGRDEEALDLIAQALARDENVSGTDRPFDDADENLNWLYNELAYILVGQGDVEGGINTFRKAIAFGESGEDNVSQVINLSFILMFEGRYEEAEDLLSIVGNASEFGRMFALAIEVCAAHEAGETEHMTEVLDEMKAHRFDNYSALQFALACVEDEEASAELLIERLSQPDYQDQAFMSLHTIRKTGVHQRRQKDILEFLDLVHQRPDVVAAAASIGRVLDLPVYSFYWGDI
ncbi:MAG: tetratricopeptide repeat protein, partial [Alphaproteobacteria bacterium]|nr:tetratricopeptide repeat protein [Alphaproteobacteria bacterium]